jgi:hypothetical protein
LRVHLQRGHADVGAIEIRRDVQQKEQRQQTQRDLSHRPPLDL